MINTKCFSGQICTDDYNALVQWVHSRPPPPQLALKIFIEWANANKTQRVTKDTHSYRLKHLVEEISRVLCEIAPPYRYEYIGNEDLICAMIRAGFLAKNAEEKSVPGPNYYFNLRKTDWSPEWLEQVLKDYL